MSWNPNQGQVPNQPNQPDPYGNYGGYPPPAQTAQGTDPYSNPPSSYGQTSYGQQPYQPPVAQPLAAPTPSASSSALIDMLKQKQNLGYVIAGGAAIIGLIAFFFPYVTVFGIASVSGAGGGWLWLEEIGALVVAAISALLIFRKNAFGLAGTPVEKQIKFGRIALIVGSALALLIHLIFLVGFQADVGSYYLSSAISLDFGYWLFMLTAIAMLVGSILALRTRASAPAVMPMYGQYPTPPAQYPPYQQPAPPTQYPSYQQPPASASQQPPQQYPPTGQQPPL